jgi:ParB/RepB/Spo0J family partition protein
MIPLSAIRDSPFHWDREITEESINDLADNIELLGQLAPIIVRPVGRANRMHELLAGKRRTLALKKLGHKEIEAKVIKCDDTDAELISLSENLKAEKPNSREWKKGIKRMVELLESKYTHEIEKAENAKSSKSKGKGDFSGPGPEKSMGRPQSPKTKAVKEAAKTVGVNPRTVEKAIKRDENLVSSAAVALERKKITTAQADKLAGMSAGKQKTQLPIMMKETREKTQERLSRESATTDNKKTEVAERMMDNLIRGSRELHGKAQDAVDFMDGENLNYRKILKMDTAAIRQCSQSLEELASFLES